jgi:YHS domain-containing protein
MALAAFLVYIIYKVMIKGEKLDLFSMFRRQNKRRGEPRDPGHLEEMRKDPICGTYLPESQAITLLYKREVHFFCSEECKNKFLELNQ